MAAEEKKPKIDLKARLGKGAAAGGGTPAATPAATSSLSSMPPPQIGSVAPPGMGSIPPPQVAACPAAWPRTRRRPRPPFGGPAGAPESTDAFGIARWQPVPAPRPTTFKIELDAETVAAAQKGGKRATILSAITLMLGLGVGFAWGGSSANNKGANAALQGAAELITEIDQSQGKVKEMAEKIGGAVKSLKEKKFPESFANDLGGLSIPFGPDKLAGRSIGRFDPRTLSMLFSYASDVDALNTRKDALKNLFTGQKKAIQEALGAGTNPKVGWTVFIQKSPQHGPVGFIAAINPAEAFAYKKAKWPESFKISNGRELVQTESIPGQRRHLDRQEDRGRTARSRGGCDVLSHRHPGPHHQRARQDRGRHERKRYPRLGRRAGHHKKGEQLLIALRKIGQK